MLETWQSMTPKPTQAERDAAVDRREQVYALQEIVQRGLPDFEEHADDDGDIVTDAMLLALLDNYGNDIIRPVPDRLRLR